MGRPGFVLEVDDRTPPLLVPDGDRFLLEKFPLGVIDSGTRPRRGDQCGTRCADPIRATLDAAESGNAADDRLR